MTGKTNDPMEALLQSLPELTAPAGFVQRLQARLDEPAPPRQYNPFQISGAVCIASALVLFLLTNTPVGNLVPQIMQTIGGWIQ